MQEAQASYGPEQAASPYSPSGQRKLRTDWLKKLGKDNRGSRPRCVLLTDGSADQVAQRLTGLVGRPEVQVSAEDRWQPQGMCHVREAELDKLRQGDAVLLNDAIRRQLQEWWLAEGRGRAKTPSWDIASTCTVSGKSGLLLVEAKAHSEELSKGDRCGAGPVNRKRIETALKEASVGLRKATGGPWRLSVEHRFQLANRFAWSWKLATLRVPVVLVYLGFLDALEMTDKKGLFASDDDWRSALLEYCRETIDPACWEAVLDVGGTPMLPLMRTDLQPFEPR